MKAFARFRIAENHSQYSQKSAEPIFENIEDDFGQFQNGQDDTEERAAIMEYDGGLSRAEAEWRAGLSKTQQGDKDVKYS